MSSPARPIDESAVVWDIARLGRTDTATQLPWTLRFADMTGSEAVSQFSELPQKQWKSNRQEPITVSDPGILRKASQIHASFLRQWSMD